MNINLFATKLRVLLPCSGGQHCRRSLRTMVRLASDTPHSGRKATSRCDWGDEPLKRGTCFCDDSAPRTCKGTTGTGGGNDLAL